GFGRVGGGFDLYLDGGAGVAGDGKGGDSDAARVGYAFDDWFGAGGFGAGVFGVEGERARSECSGAGSLANWDGDDGFGRCGEGGVVVWWGLDPTHRAAGGFVGIIGGSWACSHWISSVVGSVFVAAGGI